MLGLPAESRKPGLQLLWFRNVRTCLRAERIYGRGRSNGCLDLVRRVSSKASIRLS
jgi:hypothetical protein